MYTHNKSFPRVMEVCRSFIQNWWWHGATLMMISQSNFPLRIDSIRTLKMTTPVIKVKFNPVYIITFSLCIRMYDRKISLSTINCTGYFILVTKFWMFYVIGFEIYHLFSTRHSADLFWLKRRQVSYLMVQSIQNCVTEIRVVSELELELEFQDAILRIHFPVLEETLLVRG